MKTFIIATNNKGKLAEMSRILGPLGISAMSAAQAGITLDDVEETGETFAENAFIKAKAASCKTGLPAVADDSGLCVDALGGRPGVYTARYAGENATDDMRMDKLLFELKDVPEDKRTARFVSAVCCVFPDGRKIEAEGKCEGKIAFEKLGSGGFGYDPIFTVDGKSFARMRDSEKDALSHRGRALELLAKRLKDADI